MKIETEMKNRLHRYDVNRPKSLHEYKYSKYKKYLRMMILVCIKQHLSNIWSSIHEKVKQNWGWVEKKCYFDNNLQKAFRTSIIENGTGKILLIVVLMVG